MEKFKEYSITREHESSGLLEDLGIMLADSPREVMDSIRFRGQSGEEMRDGSRLHKVSWDHWFFAFGHYIYRIRSVGYESRIEYFKRLLDKTM